MAHFLDELPFDWARPESQALIQVLMSAYDRPDAIRFLVQSVKGVDIGVINFSGAPLAVWREVIDASSRQGRLRAMIEKSLSDESVRGFHPRLQALLSGAKPSAETPDTTLTPKTAATKTSVVIVVALKEEFRILHSLLLSRAEDVKEDGRVYYKFVIPNTSINCIATFVGDMGPTRAAVIAEKALERWRPSLAVMIGIAGGIHEDVKLGDVVIASQVDNYMDKVKANDAIDDYDFNHSGDSFQQDASFLTDVQNFEFQHSKPFQEWQTKSGAWLKEKLPNSEEFVRKDLVHTNPSLVDAHIASGPVLAASKEFLKWVRSKNRAYKAIEMESGGLVLSTHLNTHGAKSLVVRGISDYGDERKKEFDEVKSGVFREYAMRNAVKLLEAFMQAGLFI